MKMRILALLAILALLGLASPAMAEVMVYAPGAMSDAMEDIRVAAKQADLDVKVVVGHSPAQARQIADGAPADIFISADSQWMDFLYDKALLAEGSLATLAWTRLVLVAPNDTPWTYAAQPGESLAAKLGDGRLAIPDPDMIPAGRYGRAALTKLGVWSELDGKLALLPHVRAVVAMIERGELPAGIAFAGDLQGTTRTRVVTVFPADVAPMVVFPLAVISGRQRPEVTKLYDFLRGPQGQAALKARGFSQD
jgi:molybdate transport system substrate-binding protein